MRYGIVGCSGSRGTPNDAAAVAFEVDLGLLPAAIAQLRVLVEEPPETYRQQGDQVAAAPAQP